MQPGTPSSEVLAALAAAECFAGLEPGVLAALAAAFAPRDYDAGAVVFLEGEPGAGLYVVQSGRLKGVKTSPAGREQVLRFLAAGDVFNEVAVLAGKPNQVTIIALEPSRLWVIHRDVLLRLMDEHPVLSRVLTLNLAQRVLHLLGIVEDLSLRSVEGRLARLLLQQASAGGPWLSRTEMAARLGTVPDVLNRALRTLADEGLVEIDRRQIRILNRQGLVERGL